MGCVCVYVCWLCCIREGKFPWGGYFIYKYICINLHMFTFIKQILHLFPVVVESMCNLRVSISNTNRFYITVYMCFRVGLKETSMIRHCHSKYNPLFRRISCLTFSQWDNLDFTFLPFSLLSFIPQLFVDILSAFFLCFLF